MRLFDGSSGLVGLELYLCVKLKLKLVGLAGARMSLGPGDSTFLLFKLWTEYSGKV